MLHSVLARCHSGHTQEFLVEMRLAAEARRMHDLGNGQFFRSLKQGDRFVVPASIEVL
jgi:hypothetical protein